LFPSFSDETGLISNLFSEKIFHAPREMNTPVVALKIWLFHDPKHSM